METVLERFNVLLPTVMKYDNQEVIIKYSRKYNFSIAKSQQHFNDLKKFLLLCAVSNDAQSPSPLLDEIWHTFILFTKDYYHFCTNYLGKFIHHVPEVLIYEGQEKQSPLQYANSFEFARAHFDEVCEELWPSPKLLLVTCSDCSGLDGNCNGCREGG